MSTTSDITSSTPATLVTEGTRNYMSGLSGIDTEALIEAAVNAKLEPATELQAQVTANQTKISAYQEMQTDLSGMMTALDSLRNAPGTTSTASVFSERAAYLTASDGSDASNDLAVTVDDGVDPQTLTVEVDQLATVQKVESASQTSEDTALGLDGSFSIGTQGGSSATITVTSDMTLDDVANAINTETSTTGVRASVLNVADGDYRLILASTETGQSISYSTVSGTDIGQSLGITDSTGAFADQLQAAQDAIVKIDGVTVDSASNTIDDALSGIHFDLYAANPGTTISVDIEPNYSDVKSAIESFVSAYNTYREFAETNQQVNSDGTIPSSAVLFGDSILQDTNSSIYDALTQSVETDDGTMSLGAIGITFDDNNELQADDTTLDDAITNNFDAVAQLFEFQFSSSSSDLQALSEDSAMASGTYDLDITTDANGNITAASVDGDSSLFTINGDVLTGAADSQFAGLQLVYTGSSSASLTFTVSQGIGDLLYDSLDGVANSTSGTLTDAIASLESEDTDKTNEANDITQQADDYENQLIDYYATLEAKIEASQSMLDTINAVTASNSSSSSS